MISIFEKEGILFRRISIRNETTKGVFKKLKKTRKEKEFNICSSFN
jgi:hypothetical protein